MLQPKSKPAMLTPAKRSFPALAGGVAHEPEGTGLAVLAGAEGAEGATVGAAVVATVVGAAVPGTHCE